jgi:hypothetical protein
MPASLTTVNSITKEIYQGKIQEQLQNEAVGWKRIEHTSDGVTSEVGGKYVTFPVRVSRNSGIGYRNELEQLQAGGQQGYASVRVGLKYGYGRTRLSGQLIELADSNAQAFASAMDMEMNYLKTDIGKDVNRIFYGDGTGTLGVSNTAVGPGNTVGVSNTQYFEVGQVVDVVSSNGSTAKATNRTITAIVTTTAPQGTLTLDNGVSGATGTGTGTFSTVVGDLVVRQGNYGREPNGLKSIVSATGTLFNIDPTVQTKWQAYVNGNSGTNRALSEGLMIQVTDQIRLNGGQTSLILCSLGVRRAYFNLLSQQRRYTNTTEFAGGLKGLAFNNGREIPVVEDVDHPFNTMYFLDEDSFKIYQDGDWSWMDKDGSTWKYVHDFDAYEAILKKYYELGVNRRNANGVLQDITEG